MPGQQVIISKDRKQCMKIMNKLYEGNIEYPVISDEEDNYSFPYYRNIARSFSGKYRVQYSSDVNSVYEAIQKAKSENAEIITADEFLQNPIIINGWEKPKKIGYIF